LNRYNLFIHIILSFGISILSIGLYHIFFNDTKNIEKSISSKASAVAEREVLFSDKFNSLFRTTEPGDFTSSAEISRKAVVFIKSNTNTSDKNATGMYANTGSGVVLTTDGYIITNEHVISNASRVEVTLNDNRVYQAKIVGIDKSTDLAILKIEGQNLDFLGFGNSDSVRVGEWVLAVGNPFRLQSTVTAGIVSAKARNINLLQNQGIESFIQTDAAVNPGNSGGGLINLRGELIGICTAVLSESGRYEGFSFAIPSNLAKKVVSDIIQYGSVQRGWLGIEIENIDNHIASDLGLQEVSGVLLSYVAHEGGAKDAGLLSNDVIVSVENNKIQSVSEFMELTGRYKPGDVLTIVYIRKGKSHTTSATIRNQLNTTDILGIRDDLVFGSLGMEVRELDTYERAIYAPNGVMIVSLKNGSIASDTKMEPGYIITKINNKLVTSTHILKKILEDNKGKSIILEGFYPKFPGQYPYTFEMPKN